MKVKNYIRELREARGMSRQELANALGVDRVTVYRWETGRRQLDSGAIAKLASHFCVTIAELVELVSVENETAS